MEKNHMHVSFVTGDLFALDIWFNICIIIVTTAMFEYATLLHIKYGVQSKVVAKKDNEEEIKALKKCRKIDYYALRIFIVTYFPTVVAYFGIYMYIIP